MANKYDNPKAYWDVYFFLREGYGYAYPKGDSELYKMDNRTRHLALQYLYLGAQKNDSLCLREIRVLKDKKYPAEWFRELN